MWQRLGEQGILLSPAEGSQWTATAPRCYEEEETSPFPRPHVRDPRKGNRWRICAPYSASISSWWRTRGESSGTSPSPVQGGQRYVNSSTWACTDFQSAPERDPTSAPQRRSLTRWRQPWPPPAPLRRRQAARGQATEPDREAKPHRIHLPSSQCQRTKTRIFLARVRSGRSLWMW